MQKRDESVEKIDTRKQLNNQLREERWTNIMKANLEKLGEKGLATAELKQIRYENNLKKDLEERLILEQKKNTVSDIRLFKSHVIDHVN